MPLPSAGQKDIYSALLRRLISFLEQLYGLTTGSNAIHASPPEGVSPARHLASYLALSGISCWLYTVPDRSGNGDITFFVCKPQKPDTSSCFKAFPMKEWMKDVPTLTKLYAKANRDDTGYFRSKGLKPIPWTSQVANPSLHAQALQIAGDVALNQNVTLGEPAATQEPDVTSYDLFTLYGAMPATGPLPPFSAPLDRSPPPPV